MKKIRYGTDEWVGGCFLGFGASVLIGLIGLGVGLINTTFLKACGISMLSFVIGWFVVTVGVVKGFEYFENRQRRKREKLKSKV